MEFLLYGENEVLNNMMTTAGGLLKYKVSLINSRNWKLVGDSRCLKVLSFLKVKVYLDDNPSLYSRARGSRE